MTATPLVGIDRNHSYTREEICARYGYDLETTDDSEIRSRNRFFKAHFLEKGLFAVPVGKTFEVNGEIYFSWSLTNSVPCHKTDEVQAR